MKKIKFLLLAFTVCIIAAVQVRAAQVGDADFFRKVGVGYNPTFSNAQILPELLSVNGALALRDVGITPSGLEDYGRLYVTQNGRLLYFVDNGGNINVLSGQGVNGNANTLDGLDSTDFLLIANQIVTSGTGSDSAMWGLNTDASGDRSTAFGNGSTASGPRTTAWGRNTLASGWGATAFGLDTQATASRATAWGQNGVASGYTATAFGRDTLADADYATAFGRDSQATGDSSTAWGFGSMASGSESTAFGYQSRAAGSHATAFGSSVVANGTNAVAFGGSSHARGGGSIAMGWQNVVNGDNSFALGLYNQVNGASSVAIGNSIVRGDRSNSFGGNTINGSDAMALGGGIVIEGVGTQAFGRDLRVFNGMAIGWGVDNADPLIASYPDETNGALFVGFNSNASTLFVGPSAGGSTIGQIGIGTTDTNGNDLTGSITLRGDANTSIASRSSRLDSANIIIKNYGSGIWEDHRMAIDVNEITAWGSFLGFTGENGLVFNVGDTASAQPSSMGYPIVHAGRVTRNGIWAIGGYTGDTVPALATASLMNLNGSLGFKEISSPVATANYGKIYVKNDNGLYFMNEAGQETALAGTSGSASSLISAGAGEDAIQWGNGAVASGDYSTAFGNGTTAEGYASTAWGELSIANGDNSTAFGNGATASQTNSTAFGRDTEARGHESTAWGVRAIVTGDQSTAWGVDTLASGRYATAFGTYTQARGDKSFAIGSGSIANGFLSFAIGVTAIANGGGSIALGRAVTANAGKTIVMGDGINSSDPLINDMGGDNGSLMVGFNSNASTLFVGPSNGGSTTGNVAIGTTTFNGDVDLTIDAIMQLAPMDAPPTCDSGKKGAMYFDDSISEPCYCNGASWAPFDGTGSCS